VQTAPDGQERQDARARLERAQRLGHRPEAFAPPAAPLLSRAPSHALQRAVGYEFETGWLVYEQALPNSSQVKSMKKKDKVASFSSFRVEADEAEGGLSEVEFVVDPPVEVQAGGRESLEFTMNYIEIFGGDMLNAAAGNGFFRLNDITGRQTDRRFLIKKRDEELRAGPQVTSGISLEAIAEIGKTKGGKNLPEEFGKSVRTIQSITVTIDETDLRDQLPEGTMSPPLRGLVSLLVSLLWGGEQKLEYPKQIADAFLLGRTDLARVYSLLPAETREFYRRAPRTFVGMVLKAAGLPDSEETPVIVHGVRPSLESGFVPIGPPRGKWLFFLTQGFDLMSRELDAQFESMGELGRKTEEVGPQHKEAPIFELRGAQTQKIPLPAWKPFALTVFDYLLELEKP
jgi:hypothetical protein